MPEPQPPVRDLDLSDQPGETSANVALAPITAAATMNYDPGREREGVRGWIAKALFWLIVGLMVVLGLGLLFKALLIGDVEKFVANLLTPILTLFGAVMGFYFGERASSDQQRRGGGPPGG